MWGKVPVGGGVVLLILGVAGNLLLFLVLGWVNQLPSRPVGPPMVYAVEIFQRLEHKTTPQTRSVAKMAATTHILKPAQQVRFTPKAESARNIRSVERISLPQPSQAIVSFPPLPAVSTPAETEMGATEAAAGSGQGRGTDRIDRHPQRISGSLPMYPYWARREGAEGMVMLRFVVKQDGTVSEIQIEHQQGDPRFAELAREAVEGWRFLPAWRDNRAVSVWCVQRFDFRIMD